MGNGQQRRRIHFKNRQGAVGRIIRGCIGDGDKIFSRLIGGEIPQRESRALAPAMMFVTRVFVSGIHFHW